MKKYRRLKWFSFKRVPSESGKVIGEVLFHDKYKNQYRWAPEWENVSLLLLEALKTEMANKPEGAWAQVFRDLVRLAVARSEARETYPEYPEIIEELMKMVYLGSYLDEHHPPPAQVMKKVRLGPIEWQFMRCPKCGKSSRLISVMKVQGTLEGLFKCWKCGHEFSAKAN